MEVLLGVLHIQLSPCESHLHGVTFMPLTVVCHLLRLCYIGIPTVHLFPRLFTLLLSYTASLPECIADRFVRWAQFAAPRFT